jgi:hypothetical protein
MAIVMLIDFQKVCFCASVVSMVHLTRQVLPSAVAKRLQILAGPVLTWVRRVHVYLGFQLEFAVIFVHWVK